MNRRGIIVLGENLGRLYCHLFRLEENLAGCIAEMRFTFDSLKGVSCLPSIVTSK